MENDNKENENVDININRNSIDNDLGQAKGKEKNTTEAIVDSVMVDEDDGKTVSKSIAKHKMIYVSHTKKPFSFYLNLAKSSIKHFDYIELSALGTAIPTIIKIAEILKRDGLAVENGIHISTFNDSKENEKSHLTEKAKIGIVLGRVDNTTSVADDKFDMTAVAAALEVVTDTHAQN